MKSLERFYYNLGRKTYDSLPKVRGNVSDFRDWHVFEASEGFVSFKKQHKMSDEDVVAFKSGFLKLFAPSSPMSGLRKPTREDVREDARNLKRAFAIEG